MLRFDWNPEKERANIARHGISFAEATTVFADTLSRTIPDPDHSVGEHRCIIMGVSHRARLLVVVYTDDDEMVRIISARKAERKERLQYEQRRH